MIFDPKRYKIKIWIDLLIRAIIVYNLTTWISKASSNLEVERFGMNLSEYRIFVLGEEVKRLGDWTNAAGEQYTDGEVLRLWKKIFYKEKKIVILKHTISK